MMLKKVLVVYISRKKEDRACLKEIYRVLKKKKIKITAIERSKVKKVSGNIDLVIVAGGDGTFLSTSHFVKNNLMLGVNSNPKRKEGFLMQSNKEKFEGHIDKILNNKFKVVSLTRIKTICGRKKIPYALNEIFFGHKKPYKMSRFILQIGRKKEFQKSSGIIIGTPIGSYAWIGSLGGKNIPVNSSLLQYVVREPYQGRLHRHKLLKGIVDKEKIKIKNLINNGVLCADSVSEEIKINKNDTIIIKRANAPLRYIIFK